MNFLNRFTNDYDGHPIYTGLVLLTYLILILTSNWQFIWLVAWIDLTYRSYNIVKGYNKPIRNSSKKKYQLIVATIFNIFCIIVTILSWYMILYNIYTWLI